MKKLNVSAKKKPKMVDSGLKVKQDPHDNWEDDSTVEDAQRPSKTKLSRPEQKGSDAYSARFKTGVAEGEDRMNSIPPETDRAQPQKRYDEHGANRQGPAVPDMANQHNNGKAPYIKEIEDQYAEDIANANMRKVQSYAAGGMVASGSRDMNMDDGGIVLDDEQPQEENEIEEDASVAASAMAKRRYARGGEILSEDSMESDDSDEADLARNAEEDANMEDKASFDALRKENYSESEGLEELEYDTSKSIGDDIESDEHDMVSSIRKKYKKSPISR